MKKLLLLLLIVGNAIIAQAQTLSKLLGASPFDDSLVIMNPNNYNVIGMKLLTYSAGTVAGINGLARHPGTGVLYAVVKDGSGNRNLATLNPVTGYLTHIGNLGDNFSQITFNKNNTLFGVTGQGATVPCSAFTIDLNTGATTLINAVATGYGQVICYNPNDNQMYQWFGGNPDFNSWDTAFAFNTSLTIPSGTEMLGAVYKSNDTFITHDWNGDLLKTTKSGTSTFIKNYTDHFMKGLSYYQCPRQITPGSTTVCAAVSNITLVMSAASGATFQWYKNGTLLSGETSSSLNTATYGEGHYNCMVTDFCGTDSSAAPSIIKLGSKPIVSLTGSTASLCPGDSVLFTGSSGGTSKWYKNGVVIPGATSNNYYVKASGTYNMIKTNLNGCFDSAAVGKTIQFYPTYNKADSFSVCSGGTFTFYDGFVQNNITSTISHTSSFKSINNCDSIIVTKVKVNPVYNLKDTFFVCSGNSFKFHDGTTQSNLTSEVNYTSNLKTFKNCDSNITTTVKINPTYSKFDTFTICSGSNFTFHDGSSQNNITVEVNHTNSFKTVKNCDSIIYTTVKLNPVYNSKDTFTICSGSSYTFYDGTTVNNITASINHTNSLKSIKNCDSIIVTTINLNPVYNLKDSFFICSGGSFTFYDGTTQNNITTEVSHTNSFKSIKNCDSIIVTKVKINPTYNTKDTFAVCSGSSFTFHDGTTQNNITAEVTHTNSFKTIKNCDSIIVTTVKVNPTYNKKDTFSICSGSNFTFYDGTTQTNITADVNHTSNLKTIKNCDSIITTTLKVIPKDSTTITKVICNGSGYLFFGNNLIKSGTYFQKLSKVVSSCDSIVKLNLTIDTLVNTTTLSNDTIFANQKLATYQWVDCNNNKSFINAETKQFYKFTKTGSYAVILNKGVCKDTSTCKAVIKSSIDDVAPLNISIYPNPTQDVVNIILGDLKVNISLMDITGKVMVSRNAEYATQLNLGNLSDGIYFIKVQTDAQTEVYRIEKK